MPGLHQVFGAGTGRYGSRDRAGAVGGGNAGGHPARRLDRHGKGGAEGAAIGRHHLLQAQALAVLLGQGQADQPPCFTGHEADGLGVAAFGGDQQVAFVFAVFVVHQQDHLALAVVLENVFDAVEGHCGVLAVWVRFYGIP
ncbi:hypothetical protein D3C85_1035260 [compost metagenome]